MSRWLACGVLTLAGWAAAFSWTDMEFPSGDHTYVLELTTADMEPGSSLRVEYSYRQVGDGYDTTSVVTVRNTGVSQDGLSEGMFGGGASAMLMFGPYLAFYGPAAFIVPFLLANEDIAVRAEPIVSEGFATVHMDRTETHAGHECVVLRVVFDDEEDVMELGLAEGLPIPCFSRFGSEGDRTEFRLVEAR